MGEHNLDPDRFTIGFARRVTSYKRINLLLRDVRRLREIASRWGSLQIVFSGKAHPRDHEGKRLIEAVFRQQEALLPYVRLVFVPGYDMRLCGKIVAGVDLWLNTPTPPLEASGHQRDEGGPQRRAEPQRARRLVVRGLRRRATPAGSSSRRARARARSTTATPTTCTASSTTRCCTCTSATRPAGAR
jgi:hypothetical protein